MKKQIAAKARLIIPISVEFEVNTSLTEKEVFNKAIDKLNVEKQYILNDIDIKHIKLEEITLECIKE